MKKILLTLLTLLTTATLWAQAPQRISYQSIIRDGSNVVVASSPVGIKISLLQGTAAGSAVYIETHSKTTNANGLVSLEIGEGTALLGTFAGIDWANGPYLIKTETDPTGGTNYSIPGIAALNSVPYALFSANGTPGPQGERGAIGPAGAVGPAGANGIDGVAGPVGPQGPIGLTGLAGAVGPAGANGTNGIAGVAGPQGPQGPIGLTGPAGADGVGGVTTAGTNITLSGSGTVVSPYVVSANIPAAAAGTLTGNSLNATVTSSSLTSVGTLANLTVTNPIVGSLTGSSGSTTGNAATATKLATPRNINDVAFDGSADITVTAAAGSLSGTTLNATVTGSSLTSVGTIASLTTGSITNSGKIIVGASSASSASAVLEASSTTQGFLPPRMTRDQRNAIVTPAAGLIVWCTNCGTAGELQVNNGTSWTNLTGGPASFAVPGPPTNPVATAGIAQTSVAFTASTSDGGGAISGYTVTSSPGNFTATGAGSPLVVTGLASNIAYTFTVVATNSVGNSIPSAASVAVTPYGQVTSTTGRIWMDRNLGATQVATSSTDAVSYGDLYQWGRGADGHQLRNSPTTTTLSSLDQPGNVGFILATSSPNDWRSPQNGILWQGVNGVNNPCPTGYRIPTETEWNIERSSWTGGTNAAAGAFASPLKLPMARYRDFRNGSIIGSEGFYWTSTVNVSGTYSRSVYFSSNNFSILTDQRAFGNSVRCIKDSPEG